MNRWLARWTEEEIAKEEGVDRTVVTRLTEEMCNLEDLPKSTKVLADFADPDFWVLPLRMVEAGS